MTALCLLLCACNDQQRSNDGETSSAEDLGETAVFEFCPQDGSAAYTCTAFWHRSGDVFGHVDRVEVYDAKTDALLQTIQPEKNELAITSQDLLYFMDVTFDGYLDMLIPTSYSARYRAFMVYRWDAAQEQFVRVPTLLLEPAVDGGASGDFVCHYSLYFEPVDTLADNSMMRLVVEEYGKKQEFTVAGEAYQLDVNDKTVAPYYADGSFWDLDSDKWEMTACFWK